MSRRLWDNLGTMLLSLILGVLVWVIALNEENPIVERTFAQPVAVDLLNSSPDLILVSPAVTRASVTIRAPQSVWDTLTARQITVTADLAGLGAGTHDIQLKSRVDDPAAQVTKLEPASILIAVESRDTLDFPVRAEADGAPARGYEADQPIVTPSRVTVTGPSSAVASVSQCVARISLDGLRQAYDVEVTLVPMDANGRPVTRVTVLPATVRVKVPITQKQGFRDVAVKVVITGQVASGYQVTNYSVLPQFITLSSADPLAVDQLPGFVETLPLDISDATDDVVQRLALALPEGITPVGAQNVLVQVNIAAIENSVSVARRLELQGLSPGLSASPSPETVDILIFGPLVTLAQLRLEDARVILNLEGLGPGTYQVSPEVVLLSDELRAGNVLPSQIEVVISLGTPTPSPTPTPRPTARPS